MGNQSSNIYSEAVESDLNFLDLSCESFFNIDYLSSISAQIPEYEEFIGKDTRSTLESTSKSLDGYYIRSLFSNSLMPCLSKKVDISRQSSSELSPINRIRHRLMYRIREAYLRHDLSSSSDRKRLTLSPEKEERKKDDPSVILSSLSMSVCLAISSSTKDRNLVLAMCDSMSEILRVSGPLSLVDHSIEANSCIGKSLSSIRNFCNDVIRDFANDFDLKSNALALLLTLGISVGSLSDILDVGTVLSSGNGDYLPISSYENILRLLEIKSNHNLSFLAPQGFSEKFKCSRLASITDIPFDLSIKSSLTCDGKYLYVWEPIDGVIYSIGSGVHDTFAGQIVNQNSSLLDSLRETYPEEKFDEASHSSIVCVDDHIYYFRSGIVAVLDSRSLEISSTQQYSLYSEESKNISVDQDVAFRFKDDMTVNIRSLSDDYIFVVKSAYWDEENVTSKFPHESVSSLFITDILSYLEISNRRNDGKFLTIIVSPCQRTSFRNNCRRLSFLHGYEIGFFQFEKHVELESCLLSLSTDIRIDSAYFSEVNNDEHSVVTETVQDLWTSFLSSNKNDVIASSSAFVGLEGQSRQLFVNYTLRNGSSKTTSFAVDTLIDWEKVVEVATSELMRSSNKFIAGFVHPKNIDRVDRKIVLELPSQLGENFDNISVVSNGCTLVVVSITLLNDSDNSRSASMYRLDASDGHLLSSVTSTFQRTDGFPDHVCYDSRNNLLWTFEMTNMFFCKYRNCGLTPVLHRSQEDDGFPLLSYCPTTRINALKKKDLENSGENQALLLFSVLDKLSEPYGISTPELSSSDPDADIIVEIVTKAACKSEGSLLDGYFAVSIRGNLITSPFRRSNNNLHGVFVAVADTSFNVIEVRFFDCVDAGFSARLADFFSGIQKNRVVIIVSDIAIDTLSFGARESLQSLGADLNKFGPGMSFGLIGVRGSKPGSLPFCTGTSKNKGIIRYKIEVSNVPLKVDVSSGTLHRLVTIARQKFNCIRENSNNIADYCIFLSVIRLLSVNIYQISRNSVVDTIFSKEDIDLLRLIFSTFVNLDSVKGLSTSFPLHTISKAAYIASFASIDILYPKLSDKLELYCNSSPNCDNLIKITKKNMLESLIRRLSNYNHFFSRGDAKVNNIAFQNAADMLDKLLSIEYCELSSIVQLIKERSEVPSISLLSACSTALSSIVKLLFYFCAQMEKRADFIVSFSFKLVDHYSKLLMLILTACSSDDTPDFRIRKKVDSVMLNCSISSVLSSSLFSFSAFIKKSTDLIVSISSENLRQFFDQLSFLSETCAQLASILQIPVANESSIAALVAPIDIVVESQHPYLPNMNETKEFTIPGASFLSISFDSCSRTEQGVDFVRFLDSSKKSLHPSITSFSGRDGSQNWPGCEGRPPLEIEGDRVFVNFQSDGSVQDWGYKFTISGLIPVKRNQAPMHWIRYVLSQTVAVVSDISSALIKAVKWDEEVESPFVLKWFLKGIIRPQMFSNNSSKSGFISDEKLLLNNLCNNPTADNAKMLIRAVGGYEVEKDLSLKWKSVFATFAVIIHVNDLVEESMGVIKGKQPGSQLLSAWDYALSISKDPDCHHLNEVIPLSNFVLSEIEQICSDSPRFGTPRNRPASMSLGLLRDKIRNHQAFVNVFEQRKQLAKDVISGEDESVSAMLIAFLSSSLHVNSLRQVHSLRNRRAECRALGFEFCANALKSNISLPQNISFLCNILATTIRDFCREFELDYHCLNGVEGCSLDNFDVLSQSYGRLLLVLVECISHCLDKLSSENDDSQFIEWRVALLSCLYAFSFDFNVYDHPLLGYSKILPVLMRCFSLNDEEINSSAEWIVNRCSSTFFKTLSGASDEGLLFRKELANHVLQRFEKAVDSYASNLNMVSSDHSRCLIPGIVEVDPQRVGYSHSSVSMSLVFTISFWIKRSPSLLLDHKNNDRKPTVGCTVIRGPTWDCKNNDDGGCGQIGTVTGLDDTSVTVSWLNTKKTVKYSNFDDISVADPKYGGLIFSKGEYVASEDDFVPSWSVFGASVLADGCVNFFIGYDSPFPFSIRSKNQISSSGWTHLAFTLDHSSLSIYFDGVLDSSCTLPVYLLTKQKIFFNKTIESVHPYLNNSNIYEAVEAPGCSSLTVTFDTRTRTEANYDYITFFRDQTHTAYFGINQYSGGRGDSSRNFPGIDDTHPPLVIDSNSFVFHFHSDGSNNDWGYKIQIKGSLDESNYLPLDGDFAMTEDPFFFGRLPSYANTNKYSVLQSSMKGFLRRFEVLPRCYSSAEISDLFSSNKIVKNLNPICQRDVLAAAGPLSQICKGLISNDLDFFSDIEIQRSLSAVLKLLVTGTPILKSSSLRILASLINDSVESRVDSIFSDIVSAKRNDNFIDYLIKEIGNISNIWFKKKSSLDTHCEGLLEDMDSTIGYAVEAIVMLRSLGLRDYWRDKFSTFSESVLRNASSLIASISTRSDLILSMKSNIDNLLGLLSYFSDMMVSIYPGAKAIYSNDSGLKESCLVLSWTDIPSFDKSDEDQKKLWDDAIGYGDAVLVVLDSQDDDEIVVPRKCLDPVIEDSNKHLLTLSRSFDTVMSYFSCICDTVTNDMRPIPRIKDSKKDMCLYYESSHPYGDLEKKSWEIVIPGAQKLLISFDDQCCTDSESTYVRFYKDSSKVSNWGQSKYCGHSGWPGARGTPPLEIPSDRVFCFFESGDDSGSLWGYKFKVEGTSATSGKTIKLPIPENLAILSQIKAYSLKSLNSFLALSEFNSYSSKAMIKPLIKTVFSPLPSSAVSTSIRSSSSSLVFESSHPYENNTDQYIPVFVPGAKKVMITFDPSTSTESGCDYLMFYVDTSRKETYPAGGVQFSGGLNGSSSSWPGINGNDILIIPSNSFEIYFHSDGSVNSWGWKLTVTPMQDSSENDALSYIPLDPILASHSLVKSLSFFCNRPSPSKDSSLLSTYDHTCIEYETPSSFDNSFIDLEQLNKMDSFISKSSPILDNFSISCFPNTIKLLSERLGMEKSSITIYEEPRSTSNVVFVVTKPVDATALRQHGIWLLIEVEVVSSVEGELEGNNSESRKYTGWIMSRSNDVEYATIDNSINGECSVRLFSALVQKKNLDDKKESTSSSTDIDPILDMPTLPTFASRNAPEYSIMSSSQLFKRILTFVDESIYDHFQIIASSWATQCLASLMSSDSVVSSSTCDHLVLDAPSFLSFASLSLSKTKDSSSSIFSSALAQLKNLFELNFSLYGAKSLKFAQSTFERLCSYYRLQPSRDKLLVKKLFLESSHPFKKMESCSVPVKVPGASSLLISFESASTISEKSSFSITAPNGDVLYSINEKCDKSSISPQSPDKSSSSQSSASSPQPRTAPSTSGDSDVDYESGDNADADEETAECEDDDDELISLSDESSDEEFEGECSTEEDSDSECSESEVNSDSDNEDLPLKKLKNNHNNCRSTSTSKWPGVKSNSLIVDGDSCVFNINADSSDDSFGYQAHVTGVYGDLSIHRAKYKSISSFVCDRKKMNQFVALSLWILETSLSFSAKLEDDLHGLSSRMLELLCLLFSVDHQYLDPFEDKICQVLVSYLLYLAKNCHMEDYDNIAMTIKLFQRKLINDVDHAESKKGHSNLKPKIRQKIELILLIDENFLNVKLLNSTRVSGGPRSEVFNLIVEDPLVLSFAVKLGTSGAGSNNSIDLLWKDNELSRNGKSILAYPIHWVRGDILTFGVDWISDVVCVYKNSCELIPLFGGIFSGALFQSDFHNVSSCSFAFNGLKCLEKFHSIENALYHLQNFHFSRRGYYDELVPLELPKWGRRILEGISLCRSFLFREIPRSILKSAYLPVIRSLERVCIKASDLGEHFESEENVVWKKTITLSECRYLLFVIEKITLSSTQTLQIFDSSRSLVGSWVGIKRTFEGNCRKLFQTIDSVYKSKYLSSPEKAVELDIGDIVVRGSSWTHANEDGGVGTKGKVLATQSWNQVDDAGVVVLWDSCEVPCSYPKSELRVLRKNISTNSSQGSPFDDGVDGRFLAVAGNVLTIEISDTSSQPQPRSFDFVFHVQPQYSLQEAIIHPKGQTLLKLMSERYSACSLASDVSLARYVNSKLPTSTLDSLLSTKLSEIFPTVDDFARYNLLNSLADKNIDGLESLFDKFLATNMIEGETVVNSMELFDDHEEIDENSEVLTSRWTGPHHQMILEREVEWNGINDFISLEEAQAAAIDIFPECRGISFYPTTSIYSLRGGTVLIPNETAQSWCLLPPILPTVSEVPSSNDTKSENSSPVDPLIDARYQMIMSYNRCVAKIFPYVDLRPQGASFFYSESLASLLLRTRELLFDAVVDTFVDRSLMLTKTSGCRFELRLSRSKAKKFSSGGNVDMDGKVMIFSQAFRAMHFTPLLKLRQSDRIYDTIFLGERAQDAGGPYRESFSLYAQELQSSALPLFLRSQNSREATGTNFDKYILNPGSQRPLLLEMYSFLGKLMGIAIRTKEYMTLNFPSITWKLLVNDVPTMEDLLDIDYSFFNSLKKLRNIDQHGITRENFSSFFFETFSTTSSDNRIVDLIPNGSQVNVTYDNRIEYCDLVIQYRLHEFDRQIEAIRHGIGCIVPISTLSILPWYRLERIVCGSPEVDIGLLESITQYSGCSSSDEHIRNFWEVVREFSNEEKECLIRFVWGRSRLPLTAAGFSQQFKLQNFSRDPPDNYYPVSHTCFFSLELPRYSSKAIMKSKLLYAIFNCQTIDADDFANGAQAEAHHLDL